MNKLLSNIYVCPRYPNFLSPLVDHNIDIKRTILYN